MVEALLLRQLGGRSLLAGNLVALPVFGQRAVFAVEHVALRQRSSSAEVAAQSAVAAAEAAGSSKRAGDSAQAAVLPPVTAATIVRLLLEGEAAPDAATGQQQQQQQDWAGLATAEAAEALGCSIEDAGPLAARRAVMAGLNSRGITFDQLGGAAKQVSRLGRGLWDCGLGWVLGGVAENHRGRSSVYRHRLQCPAPANAPSPAAHSSLPPLTLACSVKRCESW